MAKKKQSDWPVLTQYDQDHLLRIALPLGGIGTGTVSLGGRGDLRDWEIVNRPAKGFTPRNSFFALYAKPGSGTAVTRALEGPIETPDYEGAMGARATNHGLPRFRECSFDAAYPFGQVHLADPDVPLDVRIEAFNPLVPCDADASGIPVAVLRFVLMNKTSKSVSASVCGSVRNFIGMDGTSGSPRKNVNSFKKTTRLQGVLMASEGVNPSSEQFGTIALSTLARTGITHRTAWADVSWGDALLDVWDDFSANGKLSKREPGNAADPVASLAASLRVPPKGQKEVTFLLTWHFPNRQTWTPRGGQGDACCDANRVGNYYTTQYSDAWDVAQKTGKAIAKLEAATLEFVQAFCSSDLPDVVKEAALYNLSTLRTQTCFRTEDGRFYGWEGSCDRRGCCHGSCTHVWNYEQATAFLFGELACTMREVEFRYATRESGHMSFRVNLPLDRAAEHDLAAADGQMGCIMKLYRDWQLSGDNKMLRALWPKAKKALAFCWEPGGWDADRDGVMEGCQHNTMDVEYYGPNPQMTGWYLGALHAGLKMAEHMQDEKLIMVCRLLIERGPPWVDANLFNGDYYEHEIRPPGDEAAIAPGLRHRKMGARDLTDPELQLGSGCLVDQLVGQFMAHVCGLGYLLDEKNVRKTLQNIMKYNFMESMHDHFNHNRTFALNDESALLMATYPKGRRPKRPFPYCNEVMTGFEYTAAVHMLYEGMVKDGLKCIAAIRARYDGRKRNPFNEAECGHHYARAMASWAAVLALTGFQYCGLDHSIQFAAAKKPTQVFWSNGYAWGTCKQTRSKGQTKVTIAVLHGQLRVARLTVAGVGTVKPSSPKLIRQGKSASFAIAK